MTDDHDTRAADDGGTTAQPDGTVSSNVNGSGEDALLLQFLHGRDEECPSCRYNLRDITTPTCPECGTALRLRVGEQRVILAWLLLAITPGIFSGFCGCFLLIPIIGELSNSAGPIPTGIYLLDGFGLLSGIAAIVIGMKHARFRRLELSIQRGIVITIWSIHFVAFLILLATAFG